MSDPADITFQIVVNGTKLSEANIETLATKLKKATLDELAKVDSHGDFRAKPLPTARGIGGDRTAGMIVERG